MGTLLIFAGLPAAGKSSIAREFARQTGAVYLRIDSIEQTLRDTDDPPRPLDDRGYAVAYALAADNLRLGHTVVADCVNPLALTRDAWLAVAQGAEARAVEIEVVCSDLAEHRRRVESRVADIPGCRLPSWEEVTGREYEPWPRPQLVIDTAGRGIEECVAAVRAALDDGRTAQ